MFDNQNKILLKLFYHHRYGKLAEFQTYFFLICRGKSQYLYKNFGEIIIQICRNNLHFVILKVSISFSLSHTTF